MSWLWLFITINLIGIGSNLDNSSIGIAYGIENVRFPHKINLIVNTIGFITALIGSMAGASISHHISKEMGDVVSCLVLCGIGCFIIFSQYVFPIFSHNSKKLKLRVPNPRKGILLGMGLSFTNIASGFGAAISNTVNPWLIIISIAIWGYLLLWFGQLIGNKLILKWLGTYSSLLGGLILIMVGMSKLL
jgi:putative Mn2+ efflux pump MntP